MSSKKCGVCSVVGHNVVSCADEEARVVLEGLLSDSNRESALQRCRTMSARHVTYALCRGFHVPVSGGRAKLIELVEARTQEQPSVAPSPPVVEPYNPMMVLQAVISRKASLTLRINELSTRPLELQFLPGHRCYGSNGSLPNSSIIVEKRNTVNEIAKAVLVSVVTMAMQAVIANDMPMSNFDVFIVNRINNIELLMPCIHETAALHYACVESSTGHTIECIITLIKFLNCDREAFHLYALINTIPPPPPQMKVLKTVVTCRPVACASGSCGICFDDMTAVKIVKTGCNHDFCVDCISNWAKQRGLKTFIQCPSCRTEIDKMTVGDKEEKVKLEQGLK